MILSNWNYFFVLLVFIKNISGLSRVHTTRFTTQIVSWDKSHAVYRTKLAYLITSGNLHSPWDISRWIQIREKFQVPFTRTSYKISYVPDNPIGRPSRPIRSPRYQIVIVRENGPWYGNCWRPCRSTCFIPAPTELWKNRAYYWSSQVNMKLHLSFYSCQTVTLICHVNVSKEIK